MENQKTKTKKIVIIFAVIATIVCSILGYNLGKKKALEDNEKEKLELQNK
jgi:hypothetical protein